MSGTFIRRPSTTTKQLVERSKVNVASVDKEEEYGVEEDDVEEEE
jgi:hypothetical protein